MTVVKRVLGVICGLAAFVVVYFAILGWWSGRDAMAPMGMTDGALADCPGKPNCVCSEAATAAREQHGTAPLEIGAGDAGRAMAALEEAVAATGGVVTAADGEYLHATYKSRIFRFIDDLEARRDGGQIHLRSASRVGYSDLGVNRARVEAIRAAWQAQMSSPPGG